MWIPIGYFFGLMPSTITLRPEGFLNPLLFTTMQLNWRTYLDELVLLVVRYLPNLAGAVLFLLVGYWAIRKLNQLLDKLLKNQRIEQSLQTFLLSMASIGLKVLLFVTTAGILGFHTTSFVAIFGAMGLAVGLALQGSLSNFAGGVLILIFKPFKVSDLVTILGETGNVKEIQIFNTMIVTPDNRTIILPNGAIMNNNIVNYTLQRSLLVDLKMKLDFRDDFSIAQEIIIKAMLEHPKVLRDPAPTVGILNIEGGDLIVTMRSHCKWEDYWEVYFKNYENIRKALSDADIETPQPEQFVYMMDKSTKKGKSLN